MRSERSIASGSDPDGSILDDPFGVVTEHSLAVLLVMLLLTGGMVVGVTKLSPGGGAGTDSFPATDHSRAADYVSEHYGDAGGGSGGVTYSAVYVRAEDGDALSKEGLLRAIEYQQTVATSSAIAESLAPAPSAGQGGERSPEIVSLASMVARTLTEEPAAGLEEQQAALSAAEPGEVEAALERVLAENRLAQLLVPADSGPGSATAGGHRLIVPLSSEDGAPPADAQRVLYEGAAAHSGDGLEVFTMGEYAAGDAAETLNRNTMELILPLALALILAVLAFTYRDLVDVVVGMVGVVTAVVWMFGILGWLGIAAGMTVIVGPVLIAGLSIDFGFHVFMRYREHRGETEGAGPPMRRALRSVSVALGLVTVTAAIGFLSNLVNPVELIRSLGIGITLGVASALVVFLTLVPALKLTVDRGLERLGVDHRSAPLGRGRYLRRLLGGSVTLARRAAPAVVVVGLLVGGLGAAAWPTLDQAAVQQQDSAAAEWKQDLPEPLAWEVPAHHEHRRYVQDDYAAVGSDAGGGDRFQVLVRGDVTADGTLDAVAAGLDADEAGLFASGPGGAGSPTGVQTPLSVLEGLAAEHDAVAEAVAAADTDGDGMPDEDLERVYDALYAADADLASRVLERTDDEYRSLRLVGPPERAGAFDDRVGAVESVAVAIEDGGEPDHSALAVSRTTVVDSQLAVVTDGILAVLVLALSTIGLALVAVFRLLYGSASLGAVTALPIVLVAGFVVGGMALLGVPLTLVTALLLSLVVGLGVDYTIHVSDRFAQELESGADAMAAIDRAVTGTGGALLGSTLTSAGAFGTLLVHPHPQLSSFGTLVVLALSASFVVSVVVLPSLLVLWARVTGVAGVGDASSSRPATASAQD